MRGEWYQEIKQAGAEFREACEYLDDETREQVMASWYKMKAASCKLADNYKERLNLQSQQRRHHASDGGITKKRFTVPRRPAPEKSLCAVTVDRDTQERTVVPQVLFSTTEPMGLDKKLTMSLDEIIKGVDARERVDDGDTAMDDADADTVRPDLAKKTRRPRPRVLPQRRNHARVVRARPRPMSARVSLPPPQSISVGDRRGHIVWDC